MSYKWCRDEFFRDLEREGKSSIWHVMICILKAIHYRVDYLVPLRKHLDGWMASLIQQTWTWANFGRWWGAGRPGMPQSTGLQRVEHYWATEQHMEMMLDKKKIWMNFLFGFKLGQKAAETTHSINNAFGPGTANEQTVQWWFKKFCKRVQS